MLMLRNAYTTYMVWRHWSREAERIQALLVRAGELQHNARHCEQRSDDPAVLRGCTKLEEQIRREELKISAWELAIAEIEGVQKDYNAENAAYQRRYRKQWYAPIREWQRSLDNAKTSLRDAREIIIRVRRSFVQ
jgi:hypothetical protein